MIRSTVVYFISQNNQGIPIPMYLNHTGWTEFIENAKLFKSDDEAITEMIKFPDSTYYMIKQIYYNG